MIAGTNAEIILSICYYLKYIYLMGSALPEQTQKNYCGLTKISL
jgi:hypothetical protein